MRRLVIVVLLAIAGFVAALLAFSDEARQDDVGVPRDASHDASHDASRTEPVHAGDDVATVLPEYPVASAG